MNNRTLSLATLAVLVLGAIAIPVSADGGDDASGDHRAMGEEHRQIRERHAAAHERFIDHCRDGNLTDSEEERCDRIAAAHEPGHEARRAAHALLQAIEAHYARVGRLEAAEHDIKDDLASGNMSENETADAEAKLVRIEAQQNKTLEVIAHLEDRLDALKAKWDEVAEHVAERRAYRGDHEDKDCDGERDKELAEAESEYNATVAEAAAERDAVLSDPNATANETAAAEAEYNATVEEAQAEYDEKVAEIEADHDECLAHDEHDEHDEDEHEEESEEDELEDDGPSEDDDSEEDDS